LYLFWIYSYLTLSCW